jgi:ribosomal protein L37E
MPNDNLADAFWQGIAADDPADVLSRSAVLAVRTGSAAAWKTVTAAVDADDLDNRIEAVAPTVASLASEGHDPEGTTAAVLASFRADWNDLNAQRLVWRDTQTKVAAQQSRTAALSAPQVPPPPRWEASPHGSATASQRGAQSRTAGVEAMGDPGVPDEDLYHAGHLWRYKDDRGVDRLGHVQGVSDRGGSDITHRYRDCKTGELSMVSGERLKHASPANDTSCPKHDQILKNLTRESVRGAYAIDPFGRISPKVEPRQGAHSAATYEPGLGCPDCDWTGSRLSDRQEHIRSAHPGEYSGPSEDISYAQERAGKPLRNNPRTSATTPSTNQRSAARAISEIRARQIASEWQGPDAKGLTDFSQTGRLHPDLEGDIADSQRMIAGHPSYKVSDARDLASLAHHVQSRRPKGWDDMEGDEQEAHANRMFRDAARHTGAENHDFAVGDPVTVLHGPVSPNEKRNWEIGNPGKNYDDHHPPSREGEPIPDHLQTWVYDGETRHPYNARVRDTKTNTTVHMNRTQLRSGNQRTASAEGDDLEDRVNAAVPREAEGHAVGDHLWEGLSHAMGFSDSEHMKTHRQNNEMAELQHTFKGNGKHGFDEGGEPFYKVSHPSGWTLSANAGPYAEVGHEATPDETHDAIDIGKYDDRGNHVRTPGYGHEHLTKELDNFVRDHGQEYAESMGDPRINRWNRSRRHRLSSWLRSVSSSPTIPTRDHSEARTAAGGFTPATNPFVPSSDAGRAGGAAAVPMGGGAMGGRPMGSTVVPGMAGPPGVDGDGMSPMQNMEVPSNMDPATAAAVITAARLVRSENPDLSPAEAVSIAREAVSFLPSVTAVYGAQNWGDLSQDEINQLVDCPQCGKPTFDSRQNRCLHCEYYDADPSLTTPHSHPVPGR